MALEINKTTMTAHHNGEIIATATREPDGWHVSTWPVPLDRNAAITALSLAERIITHGENDLLVIDWRDELAL